MNLEEVLDPKYGLQQDEWSLSKPKFGDESQLEVIGWSGRTHRAKCYIVKCHKCAIDSELHGSGHFKTKKSHLVASRLPCFCPKSQKRTEHQYTVLCTRKLEALGYKFLGFVGEWSGAKTKLRLLCQIHGEWTTTSVSNLLNSGNGCPACGMAAACSASRAVNTRSDDFMIDSFFASGAFHPETKFWRSERRSSAGSAIYWNIHCPDCASPPSPQSGSLRLGQRSCACSHHRQKNAYIHIVNPENPVAVKFGVTLHPETRIKQQNSKSSYKISQYAVYLFDSVESCKKAERDCKKQLECGILTKQEMPDGWSETTWFYNLEKITTIYEYNGGIKIE